MTDQQLVMAFYVLYLNTVIARLAYVIGKDRGAEHERNFQKTLLGVGTIWRVGDDGRLYEVREKREPTDVCPDYEPKEGA